MVSIRRGSRIGLGRFACFALFGPLLVAGTAHGFRMADPMATIAIPAAGNRPPETPDDPPAARPLLEGSVATSPATIVVRGAFRSIQVNVDGLGRNLVGDAANEPSIAVDPVSPSRIVIGWRQFDTIVSNFRQAGRAYSHNAGETWTFPGVLQPGQFRSDPVLAADADGNFYYYSLSTVTSAEFFKSIDGGVTWTGPVPGFGGDKQWMTIDRTDSVGRGHIYGDWNVQFSCCAGLDFTRSIDHGVSFQPPLALPQPSLKWGTLDVGPDGTLYLAGSNLSQIGHVFAASANAKVAAATPTFSVRSIDLGGVTTGGDGSLNTPNPGGLLGQVWVATDHSFGATRGNIYVLGSVDPPGGDPLDVYFTRSNDGGVNWSPPHRINDDVSTSAFQWFGTMSVAPNGRIDVVWNDTRNTGAAGRSELFYSSSGDAGNTWATNIPISPEFNSHLGFPSQNKIGDYYHMNSDNAGANLAYAATFNGEQDVYFLRIGDRDCNNNGFPDAEDIALSRSSDCDDNSVPDECEADCNRNLTADPCDISGGSSPDCDGNFVPDECEADLDGDGSINACDADIDGDGVTNINDACDFTPPGTPVEIHGRPISDTNGDCVVNLPDLVRLVGSTPSRTCLLGPGLLLGSSCTGSYDYDGDWDVDMIDVSAFQNVFGRE